MDGREHKVGKNEQLAPIALLMSLHVALLSKPLSHVQTISGNQDAIL